MDWILKLNMKTDFNILGVYTGVGVVYSFQLTEFEKNITIQPRLKM